MRIWWSREIPRSWTPKRWTAVDEGRTDEPRSLPHFSFFMFKVSTLMCCTESEDSHDVRIQMNLHQQQLVHSLFLLSSDSCADLLKEPRSKSTTSWSREDAWNITKMLKPTTWSTWALTTDVSWLHSWSIHQKRMSLMTQTKTSSEQQSRKYEHQWTKNGEDEPSMIEKDIRSSQGGSKKKLKPQMKDLKQNKEKKLRR